MSAIAAASTETKAPARPIEYRKRCGKTSSDAAAPATVSELKSTVRPPVAGCPQKKRSSCCGAASSASLASAWRVRTRLPQTLISTNQFGNDG